MESYFYILKYQISDFKDILDPDGNLLVRVVIGSDFWQTMLKNISSEI